MTNDDDREQQCVVLELKTTAIVVIKATHECTTIPATPCLSLRKRQVCSFYLGGILLRDLRHATRPVDYYSPSWWMTAIEEKRTTMLAARLGFVTSESR